MQIVWFKRDLRVEDNKALIDALKYSHEILPLYIIEPDLWGMPGLGLKHYLFLQESLAELNQELEKIGQRLIIKTGDVVEILHKLKQEYDFKNLFSHQETWSGHTYERDKKVKIWCKANNIKWHEPKQNGVIRCLKNRDGWADKWYESMKKPILPKPKSLKSLNIKSDKIPTAQELGLTDDKCLYRQKGGRKEGLKLLRSFLYERGENYSKAMSSPVTAYDACSRISAHLAFGTISIKEAFQTAEKRRAELKSLDKSEKGKWPSAINSFSGRLRWHCHFIQKLEDEPRIEFENMHKAYIDIRENDFNEEFFESWKEGKTGYPMIDACMRALTATGWLNFRMRAMLVSFASYHLWLDWRKTSKHLANLFLDYEPGIHYSQIQMQSGTTGINAVRIYNPIKQSTDHDSEGVFIRKWLPELKNMPIEFIHTPWQKPELMNDYPMPIIDEKEARKAAAAKIYAVRKTDSYKTEASKIIIKHGSRRSGLPRTVRKKNTNAKQPELPL